MEETTAPEPIPLYARERVCFVELETTINCLAGDVVIVAPKYPLAACTPGMYSRHPGAASVKSQVEAGEPSEYVTVTVVLPAATFRMFRLEFQRK
jgi:hypothetical protein